MKHTELALRFHCDVEPLKNQEGLSGKNLEAQTCFNSVCLFIHSYHDVLEHNQMDYVIENLKFYNNVAWINYKTTEDGKTLLTAGHYGNNDPSLTIRITVEVVPEVMSRVIMNDVY